MHRDVVASSRPRTDGRSVRVMVRPVTRADLEILRDLRCDLWPEGSAEEHRRELEGFFDGRARELQAILVAERNGEPVGFCELSVRPHAEGCSTDRVAYLEGWYVTPDARRHGVGRSLVGAAEAWGRHRGCSELASDTAVDNRVGTAAHLGSGFEEVGLVRCFRKKL